MKRSRSLLLIVMAVTMVLSFSIFAFAADFDAWQKASKVGPYAPEVEDWDAVYEAAKKEGKVVIYTSTSRIFDAAQSFEKAYPGVKVEAYNISSVEVYEKLEREHQANIHNADVFLCEIDSLAPSLFDRNMIVNYVPPELKPVIPEYLREPLLAHRLGSVVMAYSDIAYDGPPIESIWELTLPEWEGGLVIRDPLRASGSMNWLISFVRYHEEVAADYERVFGEPIKLTTPNAGYELIKRLLDNGMKLGSGSRDVLDAVTAHNLARPPIGATTSSKYRDVLVGDYQFDLLWDLSPSAGYAYVNSLGMIGNAPHPNGAKLLIHWLMGGNDDEHIGFEPWNVPGNFPVRTDMETPAPFKPVTEYNYWYSDQESFDIEIDVMDFWLTYM